MNDDDIELTNRVLEECAKKVCKDMPSNWRIQATNAYLKAHKVPVKNFKQHSGAFLNIDQYASISDSLLMLNFLTSWGSFLLILKFPFSILMFRSSTLYIF
jgi:hypothetical protein